MASPRNRGDVNGFLETEGKEGARVTRASLDSVQEIDFANSRLQRAKRFLARRADEYHHQVRNQ